MTDTMLLCRIAKYFYQIKVLCIGRFAGAGPVPVRTPNGSMPHICQCVHVGCGRAQGPPLQCTTVRLCHHSKFRKNQKKSYKEKTTYTTHTTQTTSMRAKHAMLYLLYELYKLFLIQKNLEDAMCNRLNRHH